MHVQLLIRHDPHREPADSTVTANQSFSIFRLVFVEAASIRQPSNNFLHVVRTRWGGIVDTINFLRRKGRGFGLFPVPGRLSSISPLVDDGANSLQTAFITGLAEIHRSA